MVSSSPPKRRRRQTRAASTTISCCTNATTAAVTVATAAALLVLVADALLLIRGAESVAQECQNSQDKGTPVSILASIPCHYLELRSDFPGASFFQLSKGADDDSGNTVDDDDDDDACFVQVLLMAAAIVAAHYLLSCLLLLFGGVFHGCHALYVPWIVAHAFILVLLATMAAAEIGVVQASIYVSSTGWMLFATVLAGLAMWIGGLVSWLEVKKMGDERQAINYYTKF